MYPRFIEIYDGCNSLSVNVDHIEWFADETVNTTTSEIRCLETYEELKEMIQTAGCSLTKPDPRIDNEPLCMKEIREMIGQPVWNSNLLTWWLVFNYDKRGDLILLRNHEGEILIYGEETLEAKPLYRMRNA